jgi:hypothetical protein
MEQISSSLFQPVYYLGLIAVVLIVVGNVIKSRGAEERGEKVSDIGFGVALLTGAYIVVLFLIALVSQPNLVYDAVVNILILGAFFLLLLFLLFGLFELILSRGQRRRAPREGD